MITSTEIVIIVAGDNYRSSRKIITVMDLIIAMAIAAVVKITAAGEKITAADVIIAPRP